MIGPWGRASASSSAARCTLWVPSTTSTYGALAHDVAILLGEAARHDDLAPVARGLPRLQVAEVAVELVVGVLADAARVEHDHVGVGLVGGRHQTVGLEQPGDALGVVLVHLAPVGADDVGAGHGPEASGPHRRRGTSRRRSRNGPFARPVASRKKGEPRGKGKLPQMTVEVGDVPGGLPTPDRPPSGVLHEGWRQRQAHARTPHRRRRRNRDRSRDAGKAGSPPSSRATGIFGQRLLPGDSASAYPPPVQEGDVTLHRAARSLETERRVEGRRPTQPIADPKGDEGDASADQTSNGVLLEMARSSDAAGLGLRRGIGPDAGLLTHLSEMSTMISGFSPRKVLAFSRPWPSCSPS